MQIHFVPVKTRRFTMSDKALKEFWTLITPRFHLIISIIFSNATDELCKVS